MPVLKIKNMDGTWSEVSQNASDRIGMTDLEVTNNTTLLDVSNFDYFVLENNYGTGIWTVALDKIDRTSTTIQAEGDYTTMSNGSHLTYAYSVAFTKSSSGYIVAAKYSYNNAEWADVAYTKIYGCNFGASNDNGAGKNGLDGKSAYEIAVEHGFEGTEEEWLISLKGATGATGAAGNNGKDGTSVTVASVTESELDGDFNTVVFSDGKTVTIKNGSKGSKGDKGDPYTLTEVDKAEIVQSVLEGIGSPVYGFIGEDNHITLKGNLAEDRNYTFAYEMDNGTIIDIGKAEFVPEGPSYTNQIPISTDTDGSIYGFTTDTYISSSSGAVSAKTGICTTGFIPCDVDDVVRFENLEFNANASNANYYRLALYDKDKKFIKIIIASSTAAVGTLEQDADGRWKKFVVGGRQATLGFIRVCCAGITKDSIITINEEIV